MKEVETREQRKQAGKTEKNDAEQKANRNVNRKQVQWLAQNLLRIALLFLIFVLM